MMFWIVIKGVNVLIDCTALLLFSLYVLYARHMLAATVTVEICMQCIHQIASASASASYFSTLLYSAFSHVLFQTLIFSTEDIQPVMRNPANLIIPLCEHATRISACSPSDSTLSR